MVLKGVGLRIEAESYCMMRRMPAPGSPRDRVLLGILAMAAFLFLLGVHWGLPNTHAWNGDDISPDKPLRVVWSWLFGSHKYPYLHWWISALLYAPFLAFWAATGRLDAACFPRFEEECFADPTGSLTVLMALSRGLSVVMSLGTVWLVHATARALGGGRAAALGAAAAAACAPVLVFYAHTGNLDAPMTFWLAASLFAFARIVVRGAPLDHLAFGALLGCAVATKEGVVGAYLLPAAAVYGLHLRRRFWPGPRTLGRFLRASLDARMVGLAGLALGIYTVVQNVLFNFPGFLRHLEAWNPAGERMTGFRGGFDGWAGFGGSILDAMAEGAGGGVVALAGVGLVVAAFRRLPALWLALPAVSYVALSLGAARFAPVRFALPLVPILAVFVGVALEEGLRGGRARRALAAGVFALAVGHAFLRALHLDLFLLDDARYRAEAFLRAHAEPAARVAVFAPDRYLPRLGAQGLEVWRVPEDAWSAEGLRAGGATWVVLSERFHPRFRDERRLFFDALRAGSLGWTLRAEARGTTPLEPWLGGPGLVGAVNPTVTILGPPPPQR